MSRAAVAITFDADFAEKARETAAAQGLELDAFVRGLVERAISDFRGQKQWQNRAVQADLVRAREIVRRAGGQLPAAGDEGEPRD